MIEDLLELLGGLFSGLAEHAPDIMEASAYLGMAAMDHRFSGQAIGPSAGLAQQSSEETKSGGWLKRRSSPPSVVPEVPPSQQEAILQELDGHLHRRLMEYRDDPRDHGARAHDQLLLEMEDQWLHAADGADTHQLLDHIEVPYPDGSQERQEFVAGFLWANRDVAAFIHERTRPGGPEQGPTES